MTTTPSLPDEIIEHILGYLNPVDCLALSMANILPRVTHLLRRRKSFDLRGNRQIATPLFRHLIEDVIDFDRIRFLRMSRGQDLPMQLLSQAISSSTQLEELHVEELLHNRSSTAQKSKGMQLLCKTFLEFIQKQFMLDGSVIQGFCQHHLVDGNTFFSSLPLSFKLHRLRKLVYSTSASCDCAFRVVGELLSISPNLQKLQIVHRSEELTDITRLPWEQISKLQSLRELSISCDSRLSISNFSKIMNQCRRLERLHLSVHLIDDLGVVFDALLPTIILQTNVRKFILTCGPTDLRNMRYIERIQNSPHLERLGLGYRHAHSGDSLSVGIIAVTCSSRNMTRG